METRDDGSGIRCNEHPDAPHGFLRDASHNAGRYVCECEFWEPQEHTSDKEKLAKWMMERGFATGHGDTIEDLLQELDWQIAENSKWVGLTDEESVSLLVKANKPTKGQRFTTAPEMAAEFGRLVSELLKERNT